MTRYILLLHGSHSHPITMRYIQHKLQKHNFTNIINPFYKSSGSLQDSINSVNDILILKQINKINDTLVIIGHSLGGIISKELYKKGWNIELSIAIASPIRGARILKHLEQKHNKLYNFIKTPLYDDFKSLIDQEYNNPQHPFYTISTNDKLISYIFSKLNIIDNDDGEIFDSCIYKDETIGDIDNHIHIEDANHHMLVLLPRTMKHIFDIFDKENINS